MPKNKKTTTDPLNTSLPMAGESITKFENLPAKIKQPKKISPDVIKDTESLKFVELQQVKHYVEQFGDDAVRISKLVGVSEKRAKKLIADVYGVVWGIEGRSSAEQRRRHKKRHVAILNRLVETGLNYIDNGVKGKPLTPAQYKQISGDVKDSLSDIAKMHGIGNTVIFEQFNQQTNISLSPAQQGIEKDKDMRFLLSELGKVLTDESEDDIVDAEIQE